MKRNHILIISGVVILAVILVLVAKSKNDNGQKVTVSSQLLKEADDTFDQGNIIEAKALYKEAMATIKDVNALKDIQDKIEKMNMKIIFSMYQDNCSQEYIVKAKDVLSKIAKKYKTTVNLIKRSNGLESDTIRLGQKLKVNICSFSIVVDKSQNILLLKRNGEVLKTYIVSTGKDGNTPIGKFAIVNKLVKPTWFRTGAVIPPDSPENVLGSRWLGFNLKGYGIHGTNDPDNLGKQITLGCVRMRNEDVNELFDMVPVETEVIIIE